MEPQTGRAVSDGQETALGQEKCGREREQVGKQSLE